MRLLEYEAKQILRDRGFEIPRGVVVRRAGELDQALPSISFPAMVKAQVPIGGRGKAGAVIRVEDARAARDAAERLLCGHVRGYPVEALLLEEAVSIRGEFFLAVTYDTVEKQAILLASGAGGVDVEAPDQASPGRMVRRVLDVRRGLHEFEARQVAAKIGLAGRDLMGFAGVVRQAADAFLGLDCTLLEINPLARTDEGRFVVADAHLEVDEDALYRQPHLETGYRIPRREASGRAPTEFERRAAEVDAIDHRGVAGRVIEFDGNLGLLIGGGGASLTAFDAIRRHGGRPANYCEIGGNPSVRKVAELTKLILSRPGVERIAVIMNVVSNTRVDLIARGVIQGSLEAGRDPGRTIAAFRVPGSWEEEGFTLLRKYGVEFCDRGVSIDEASRRAVARQA
ncbi:MAG: acetate--CoA ligase family protein [candidate division NC10 bacterium]|nr:acetate--CoA ligase family protein [candidate division NC10 bacterium]